MKNLRKSRKALSPVVASIILIAVTVAVSIAVAAWMGALTIGFMGTEELKITSLRFNTGNQIQIIANNTGTSPVTISEVWVSGTQITSPTYTTSATVSANRGVSITFTQIAWENGNNYQFKLVTSKGNTFMYTAIAPST
jgi:flagellin-like protein